MPGILPSKILPGPGVMAPKSMPSGANCLIKRSFEGPTRTPFAMAEPLAESLAERLATLRQRLPGGTRLLAVSKGQPASLIREAVAEVQAFVKAPIPLVAASALSAVSLASQGIVSVERATGLVSPCSLFFITIADSGERKSTCDRLFIDPIRRWQIDEAKRLDPEVKEHRAKYAAWKAEKDGLELLIKQQARKQQSTAKSQADLADAMGREPISPRLPDLIYADATPEALAFGLSKWPSGGLMAHEGGVVLGSHGMNAEAVMRNLALLDSLWDGIPYPVRRRTSDSFELINARLTIGLQVQPAAFRSFYEKTGGISRGIGFLARCLLSWPTSTQGSRTFSDPPEAWPGLNAFQERITALLNFPLSFDESGHLNIPVIALNPSAK
ncbi:MAG: DUF3987 domain-containing protein, partial [Synechococcaceae bacterium WB9_2_170]|nr:DUF3987 domain-containing protein [Synechococcaceae bacterium WB9_2_170]